MAIQYSWPLHVPLQGLKDRHRLINVVKQFANAGDICQGMNTHFLITQASICLDTFLGNTLVSMYAKCGLLQDASKVLHMMPVTNIITWTVIITCHAKHGCHHQVIALFKQMLLQDLIPNAVILVCVVNSCTCEKALRESMIIHSAACEHGLGSDMLVRSSLVHMYAKHACMADAEKIFDDLLDKNVVTWTSMIAAYTEQGFAEKAVYLFQHMQNEGVKLDQVALINVLKACTSLEDLDRGRHYHVVIVNIELTQTVSLDNALVNMYAKCGRIDTARLIFEEMDRRDVASWSMVIAGCVEHGQPKNALDYFMRMQDEKVIPNHVTFICVLKACASLDDLALGQAIHDSVLQNNFWLDLSVTSALIDMYTKCGQIGDAYHVFQTSVKKDVVLWTTMISGYVQQGFHAEALELFAGMLIAGVDANSVTFVSVLCACACLTAIKEGTIIHEQICKGVLETIPEICMALINMYSKCGSLEDARRIFDLMPVHNPMAWTIMVTAYAKHGHGKEALKLVDQMQQKGLKLDHVSLVSVIAACNNEGLVFEASNLVTSMCIDNGFVLSGKHYGCVADALGRAGQLEGAEAMLQSMPLQPNAVSWRSILSAWRSHAGPEPEDKMSERIFEFEPRSADDFVLLSNLYYSAAKRSQVKKLML